jgi:hypothetical protein
MLMSLLYAARVARFDLLRAVCALASKITKWTRLCDRKLLRLIQYVNSTTHLKQYGWVGDNTSDVKPVLYCDADFAGCPETQRSTSGGHLNLEGPLTRFPVMAKSAKQTCVSTSTPEAEIIAAFAGHRNLLLPSFDIWDLILPCGYRAVLYEDNQPTQRIIEKQQNPTMKHLGRSHRVGLRWLFERLGGASETRDPVDVVYCRTARMAADIYTKGFSDHQKWTNGLQLINVMDRSDLNSAILRHFKTGSTSTLDTVEASAESPESNVNGKLPAGACVLPDTTVPRLFVPRARGEAGATSDEPEMKQNFSEVLCGDAHSARATAKEGLISEDCDIEDDPGADFLRS